MAGHDPRLSTGLARSPVARKDSAPDIKVAPNLNIGKMKFVTSSPDIIARGKHLVLLAAGSLADGEITCSTGLADIVVAMKLSHRQAANRAGRKNSLLRPKTLPAGVRNSRRPTKVTGLVPAVRIILLGIGRPQLKGVPQPIGANRPLATIVVFNPQDPPPTGIADLDVLSTIGEGAPAFAIPGPVANSILDTIPVPDSRLVSANYEKSIPVHPGPLGEHETDSIADHVPGEIEWIGVFVEELDKLKAPLLLTPGRVHDFRYGQRLEPPSGPHKE